MQFTGVRIQNPRTSWVVHGFSFLNFGQRPRLRGPFTLPFGDGHVVPVAPYAWESPGLWVGTELPYHACPLIHGRQRRRLVYP
jgi:hypothetical protein